MWSVELGKYLMFDRLMTEQSRLERTKKTFFGESKANEDVLALQRMALGVMTTVKIRQSNAALYRTQTDSL